MSEEIGHSNSQGNQLHCGVCTKGFAFVCTKGVCLCLKKKEEEVTSRSVTSH